MSWNSGFGAGGYDQIGQNLENQVFNSVDRNRDGFISYGEAANLAANQNAYGAHNTMGDVNRFVNNADANRDGFISRGELDRYM